MRRTVGRCQGHTANRWSLLKRWLDLLTLSETYTYKHDTAKKNMLKTLLARVNPVP
jgi:hypothetical protein